MKVTKAEIFAIPMNLNFAWNVVLIRVHTDEGISGVGEVGLAYGVGYRAGVGMLRDFAEACLIGADPFATEEVWRRMQTRSFWGLGTGPILNGGMSAIDIALWDIKGKALNEPVYRLLGGPCRDSLQAYASQVQFGWTAKKSLPCTKPEEYAEQTRIMMEEGYNCVKVNPIRYDADGNLVHRLEGRLDRRTLEHLAAKVRAVREAGGPGLGILIEFNAKANTSAAIQVNRVLAEYDCLYFEEPVHNMTPALLADIKREAPIPLAAGERLYTRWDFLPYLENRIIALAQPDIGLGGGITEVKKICDMAHAYDIEAQLHVCGSPVAAAASLHLEAAIPNFRIHEHHVHLIKPENRDLCLEDNQPVNGYFNLPKGPGIGIALNEDVLAKHPPVVVQ